MSKDIIYREGAIKAISQWLDNEDDLFNIGLKQAIYEIKRLPSADRPQGEWIEVDDVSISCRCSVCGWEAHLYEDDVYGMPYCPNCGARMKGADDDIDNV